jgi:hypothetical protein
MDNESDLRFVDAHTEGVGCYDYTSFVVNPIMLFLDFMAVLDSGVVKVGGDVILFKEIGNFFGSAAAASINYT